MVRFTFPRIAIFGLLGVTVVGTPLHARPADFPTDRSGRQLRDSAGKPLNYDTAPDVASRTAKGFATAASTEAPVAPITPSTPEWQYSIFGTSIGASGILIEENNGVPEIYVGGSARGSFWPDDFWQVLRWDASTGSYQQVWVSALLPSPLVRLATSNVIGDASEEIVAALEDGTIIFYNSAYRTIMGSVSLGVEIRQMRLRDLNSNGAAEIIVTTDSDLRVYNSSGTLQWSVDAAGGNDLVIANMDTDPALEIATTSGKVVDVATHAVQWAYPGGFGAFLRATDVDADGRAELIAAAGWYDIYCYDVDTKLPKWSISAELDIGAITLANVDDDPLPELLVGDGQWGAVHAYDLTTRAQQWEIENPEHGVTQIAVGDVDSDGQQEVLWGAGATSTGEDHLYVADIASRTIEWQNEHLDGPFLSPRIGDLDGDGMMELVTATTESDAGYSSGRILVFDAATRTLRGISAPVCEDSSWTGIRDLELRDIDGDGGQDIVIAADWLYDGTIEIYGFDAENTFAKKWTNAVRPEGSPFTAVDVVDIDGDGNLEVVAGNGIEHTGSDGGFVRFYDLATAQQEWQSVKIATNWNSVADIAIADFDQDGRLEVLALVPGESITSFDGPQKATDGQVIGAFTALAGKADGSVFYAGDSAGQVISYTHADGTYVPGTPWVASAEAINGITLEGTTYWVNTGGLIQHWAAPNIMDWTSIALGDFASPHVATFNSSSGRSVYLGTLGTLAEFSAEAAGTPKPIVSITGTGTGAISEKGEGARKLKVSLDAPATAPLRVQISASGSAAVSDYELIGASGGSVSFETGQQTRVIKVKAVNDALPEGNEDVVVTLQDSDLYKIGASGSATVSIVDDESIISVLATDSQASEQISVRSIEKGILTLQRTGSRAKLLVVDYSLTGTATNGTDYRLLSGKATFRPGKNKVNVRIVPIADQLPESAENVVLTLTPSSLYGIDPGATTGEVTITD